MKTLEQIAEAFANKERESCLDGRDINRLAQFIPYDLLPKFDLQPNEEWDNKEKWDAQVKPFTRENVLKQLEEDVAFGFEKALNKRGISSSLMYHVVQMWNWILEEGLEDFDDYPMYGLPLFKATAVKYGFDNPIGDDTGSEEEYNESGY